MKRLPQPWTLVLGASLVAVALADAFVLDAAKAFFGSGYNGFAMRTPLERAAFFAAGMVLDLALLSALWCALWALADRLPLSPLRKLTGVACLALAVPLLMDVSLHQLHRVLGDVIGLGILLELAAGDARNALGEALDQFSSWGLVFGAAGAGLLGLWLLSGWFEGWLGEQAGSRGPSLRGLAGLALGSTALATLILLQAGQAWPALGYGLGWKPSGIALGWAGARLTDLDGDGVGMLGTPRDAAPLDGSRHPFALEVPGDGIDANGWAGDLPGGWVAPRAVPVAARMAEARPTSLLLVFLESFRADLLGMQLDGREVTPRLNRLAREGSASDQAFVHTAMTWPSRGQLLQGRVVARPGARTLVDDFKERGYEVAWFSGQHDGLRDSGASLGFDRADVFMDARADTGRRTSRSERPISLQVSWQTVVERVTEFLASRSPERPLFLYVNLVDTHFPYDNDQLERILSPQRLERAGIVRENREQVWRAYLNAAANVDRGLAGLLEQTERALPGELAVVVTADHGEAFYEERFLGHGQAFDRVQSQVPLVVRGIGGDWPEPLALSDLRGLVLNHLGRGEPDARPRFVPDPERGIFQYAGSIERPRLLGLQRLAGVTVVDLDRRPPVELSPQEVEVLRTWEALRWELAGESSAAPQQARAAD